MLLSEMLSPLGQCSFQEVLATEKRPPLQWGGFGKWQELLGSHTSRLGAWLGIMTLVWLFVEAAPAAEPTALTTVPLGSLAPDSVQQGWGELRNDRSVSDKPLRFTIASPTLTLGLTEDGDICSIKAGSFSQPVRGGIRLSGCQAEGKATVEKREGGGVVVLRKLRHPQGAASIVVKTLEEGRVVASRKLTYPESHACTATRPALSTRPP